MSVRLRGVCYLSGAFCLGSVIYPTNEFRISRHLVWLLNCRILRRVSRSATRLPRLGSPLRVFFRGMVRKKSGIESVTEAVAALRGKGSARKSSVTDVVKNRRSGGGKPKVVATTAPAVESSEGEVKSPVPSPAISTTELQPAEVVVEAPAAEVVEVAAEGDTSEVDATEILEPEVDVDESAPDFEFPDPVSSGVVEPVVQTVPEGRSVAVPRSRRAAEGSIKAIAEGRYRDSFTGRRVSVRDLANERTRQSGGTRSGVKASVKAVANSRVFKGGVSSPSAVARMRLQNGNKPESDGRPKLVG